MSNIAIKGHATRGNEVIQILEMLGGQCVSYSGFVEKYYYSIDKYDNIFGTPNLPNDIKYKIFTIEEFLEKYPYKVGDKIKCWINGYCSINNIKDIQWDSIVNEIKYKIQDYWYSTMNLQPYKKETMEEPKELLIGFTKDSDGNFVLNTHKDYEIKEVGGKFKLILKKPQYPKTYKECCKILKYIPNSYDADEIFVYGYMSDELKTLQKLLICRDAYWKIAGEEMGLGEPWKPNWTGDASKYTICSVGYRYELCTSDVYNRILAFPTKEMRDIFFENFKELIEICKEFL